MKTAKNKEKPTGKKAARGEKLKAALKSNLLRRKAAKVIKL